MDAFWGVTTMMFILFFVTRNMFKDDDTTQSPPQNISPPKGIDPLEADKIAQKKLDEQKRKDIRELKKQGYSDELITIILPTLYNDK